LKLISKNVLAYVCSIARVQNHTISNHHSKGASILGR
jgi:hypothetical protein